MFNITCLYFLIHFTKKKITAYTDYRHHIAGTQTYKNVVKLTKHV